MADVKTTWTSDAREVERVIERLQRKVISLEEGHRKGSQASADWEKQTIRFVKSAVLGYASIQTAAKLVGDEWRNILSLQSKAGQFQITEAGSQAQFLRNLGLVTPQEQQASIARIRSISTETGVGTPALFQAASTAVSAKGDLNNQQALDAVQQAARVAPESVDELRGVAGGLLDLAAVTKTPDAKQNLGFLMQLASLSRVTNLQQLSENVAPSAIGITQFGDTPAQAASLVATITSTIKDASGAISGNTAQQLAGQLEEFLPTKDLLKRDSSGKVTGVLAEGTGLNSTTERLEYLRSNPDLAQAFLQQASFRQKGLPAVKELLGVSKGPAPELFARNVASFGDPALMAANVDDFVGNIQSIPQQRLARIARQIDVGTEGLLTVNQQGGEAGAIRDRLQGFLEASGQSSLATKFKGLEFNASTVVGGQTGLDRLIIVVERLVQKLESPIVSVPRPFVDEAPLTGGFGAPPEITRPPNAQEQAQIKVLTEMLEQLKGIREDPRRGVRVPVAAGEN